MKLAELLKKAPEFDYLITAESKGIPLAYEMARQIGAKKWMLARKGVKLYMKDVIGVEVRSITTDHVQKLYIDGEDAALMKGKRILIVDDVVSTGESLHALETLVNEAGGIICGRACILAEGEARRSSSAAQAVVSSGSPKMTNAPIIRCSLSGQSGRSRLRPAISMVSLSTLRTPSA